MSSKKTIAPPRLSRDANFVDFYKLPTVSQPPFRSGVIPLKIAVIGTGYVGLVTATCLAESGNEVIGIDRDERKIKMLDEGKLPIYEPGLLELVQRNFRDQRLTFTPDLARGVAAAQIIFIAVGTPQNDEGASDLTALWSV